jgi:hypothetical protein
MAQCESCFKELSEENGRICNKCNRPYCTDHIDQHPCEDRAYVKGLAMPKRPESETSDSKSSGSSNLLAGAILLALGVLLSVTGFGMVIGIPLSVLGFGVMFPRFMKTVVGLAILAFIWLKMTP